MAYVDATITSSAAASAGMEPTRVRDAAIVSSGIASSSMAAAKLLIVSITSGAIASATMARDKIVSAEMLSAATAGSSIAVQAVLNAVMQSLAISGSVLTLPDAAGEVWVVNLDSNGSTTYTNYPFNSYAKIGGRYYGASDDGVHLLEGDTDDGDPIAANVSLGKRDFDSSAKKTVSHCYVGMSGQGNLFVKVIAEGKEYLYKTRSYSPEMQQQRVMFGKGLRANYVTLELYNEGGADFEVDTIEFVVADLSRKI